MKAPFLIPLFVATFISLNALADPADVANLQARVAKGDAEAELDLGRMYHTGKGGVGKNFAKAADLYQKAATQGNAKAMYNIGYLYSHGQGVPQNDATAAQWFQKSADQALPAGEFEMGMIYDFGDRGLPADHAAAIKWFTLAFEHLDSPVQKGTAANLLGTLTEPTGMPPDAKQAEQAVYWYTQGAELDDTKAQSNLGQVYESGHLIKKDFVQSYKWLKLAAIKGDPMALHLIPGYVDSNEYSPAVVAEGDVLIKEFQEKHHLAFVSSVDYPHTPTVPSIAPVPATNSAASTASPAAQGTSGK